MKSYRVKWEIEVDADSPEEAAQNALEIQRDEDSTAVAFFVTEEPIFGHKTKTILIDFFDGTTEDVTDEVSH